MAIDQHSTMNHNWRPYKRIALAMCIIALFIGALFLYSDRHVHNVTLHTGETTVVEVKVPMQRLGQSKSFAKEQGLPATCDIAPAIHNDAGVHLSVIAASHSLHQLHARLRVHVDADASSGIRQYTAAFAIDDEADWPTADIRIKVLSSTP